MGGGVDRLAQQEAPIPEISDGEVLVRVSRVGICGSDLAILRGQHARAETGVILVTEGAHTHVADRRPCH
jgi:(R,R)-butanediol dehydrogenase/meso-butanediol dehydrogenase/diacetyl reductase